MASKNLNEPQSSSDAPEISARPAPPTGGRARVAKASAASLRKPAKKPAKILQIPALSDVKKFVRQEQKTSIIAKALQKKASPNFVETIEIPSRYNTTRLALMPRDPYWMYATWEIAGEDIEAFKKAHGLIDAETRFVLRVYDVTLVEFNGHNANHSFDIEIGPVLNWYINLWADNVAAVAELGLKSTAGEFFPFTRSNIVRTPPQSVSWRSDQIWMEIKDDGRGDFFVEGYEHDPKFDAEIDFVPAWSDMRFRKRRRYYISVHDVRLYYEKLLPRLRDIILAKIRGTLGKKVRLIGESLWDRKRILSLLPLRWLRRLRLGASEELVEMEGAGGGSEQIGASASMQITPRRKFFFEIWADLIVYGRTEPDATVTLGKEQILLKPDGTFSLRYTLPDGKIPFDFTAASADGEEERSISTEVNRNTFVLPPVMLRGKINQ